MSDDCIVEMRDIKVQFPGVLALKGVNFDLRPGEVHALMGENGAGKSTLMKVLAGVYTNYEGTITYKGEQVVSRSIQEQRERGVSIIFQEMELLPNLTVAENIFLGRQPTGRAGSIDWTAMNRQARKLLDSVNTSISERELVSSLSVGQMQMVEIAKALSFSADVIIMDEPTAALTGKEVDALFDNIRDLRAKGVAICYISHRLEEIKRIADRVTVFRDGANVGTRPTGELSIDEMVTMMVGREMDDYYPKVETTAGDVLLELRDIRRGDVLKGVSFAARAGEITGLYGLMGAGCTELMRVAFGADRCDSGEILVAGEPVRIRNPMDAKRRGIALLTEDRKQQGLILDFDINANITLANFASAMGRFGFDLRKENEHNQELAESVRVKTPSLKQKARFLSGGNQQKVVLAKWLNTDSEVFIFDEPTRGIDVGAKAEIYRIMNRLKQDGKAVVVVSSELTECMGISDRIYVMHEGSMTALIEGDEMRDLSEEVVVAYATGARTGKTTGEEA